MGSIPAVDAGTLIVLASGDEGAIELARPVLQSLGEVRFLGALGNGSSLKLIANTTIAGVSALAAELLAAGARAGLNVDDVFWALSRISPYLNSRRAGLVDHQYEPVTFALRDAVKDLRLATDLYKRVGASTPLSMETKALFEKAAESSGELDMSAISSLYQRSPTKRG